MMKELQFRQGDLVCDKDGMVGAIVRGLWLVDMKDDSKPAEPAYWVRYDGGREVRRLETELIDIPGN
jgi:hypothetical protein